MHGDMVLRKTRNNETFVTDDQHFTLDAPFGRISDVDGPDMALLAISGVVEAGRSKGLHFGRSSQAKATLNLWSR